MDTFKEDGVFQPLANRSDVVLDSLRKFFGSEIGLCHNNNLDTLQNDSLPLQNDLLHGHYAQEYSGSKSFCVALWLFYSGSELWYGCTCRG